MQILQLEELKQLAKILDMRAANKSRNLLATGILAMRCSRQTRLTYFAQPSFANRKSIAQEATERIVQHGLKLAGPILRIPPMIRTRLDRLVALYFLETISVGGLSEPVEAPIRSLGTAILTDINRIKYPPYSIVRNRPVFMSRHHWEAYEEAIAYEKHTCQIVAELEEVTIDILEDLLEDTKKKWQYTFTTGDILTDDVDKSLYFLQRYTPGWIYTRMLAAFVALLERARAFFEANRILEMLLGQDKYCRGQRGKWWERLVLNSAAHLGLKEEAGCLIKKALLDPHVRTASKLALQRRQCKFSRTVFEPDQPPPTITIYADPEDRRSTGKKLFYLLPSGLLGSVEELALAHYEQEGWSGVQSESRIYRMLFALLFWDILFAEVPNVFQTPHQTAPLDLCTDAFYATRQDHIEDRLMLIAKGNAPQILVDAYYPHYGCQAIGVQWEEYPLSTLLDIIHSLGGSSLVPIMRELAEDYAGSCSGLPDLLLYRPDRRDYLLVEVKSTRDRLSDAQRHWNAIFSQHGVKYALCRVLDTSLEGEPVIKRSKRQQQRR